MPYTEYLFNSSRYQNENIYLAPPLKLKKTLCYKRVAQLPTMYKEKMIIPFTDGSLTCFSLDGVEIWKTQASVPFIQFKSINWGQIRIFHERILAYYDERIFSINFDDGEIFDMHYEGQAPLRKAMIVDKSMINLFYKKDDDSFFYGAFDLEKKEMVWTHPFNSTYYDQVLTGTDDRVIVYENDEELCCLEIKTGKVLWRSSMVDIVKKARPKQKDEKIEITGVPFIWENKLFLTFEGARIASVDMDTGATRWAISTFPTHPRNAVLYADHCLYATDGDVWIIIDAESGKILLKKDIKSFMKQNGIVMPANIAVSDDTIFVADNLKGTLLALDKKSLELVWSHNVKSGIPFLPGPTIIDGKLYVLDSDNRLHVFEHDEKKTKRAGK